MIYWMNKYWMLQSFTFLCFSTGNPLLTSKVNILINVLDVNEFPPEISVPFETAVCENAKPGQVSYKYCSLTMRKTHHTSVLGSKTRNEYKFISLHRMSS
jgi:hypothetical protein